MKKLLLQISVILIALLAVSCSSGDADKTVNKHTENLVSGAAKPTDAITPSMTAEPADTVIPSAAARPTEAAIPSEAIEPTGHISSPTGSALSNDELPLSQEEKEKLGLMIKWIYQINLIQSEKDDQSLQLPEKIGLLPTDTDKMRFVTDMVVIEHMAGVTSDDGLNYTFTKEEADDIVASAVGERFDEHKASDYVGGYSDGIYSYSMVGADGAAWWPDIEICKVSAISDHEIQIEGILKSEHDIYQKTYTFHFEAVAVTNTESLFGGYTLKELKIFRT